MICPRGVERGGADGGTGVRLDIAADDLKKMPSAECICTMLFFFSVRNLLSNTDTLS
ncbi:hypothetical protein B0H14DRAFT_3876792, partial [Mycena olivaceomarginata]